MNNEERREEQKFRLEVRIAVLRYVVINAFLAFVNWMTTPHYWWVGWVIAGWGLGLVLNIISGYLRLRAQERA